ncbi:MAG: AAA family ATPase [Peptococcaceae bacterium]|nr:AAA family ATPase [Peptococcaceae bacterium]
MRILRIRAKGLPLYQDAVDISFFASQRVQFNHQDAVSNLFSNIAINNAEAFVGINASGKTTALNLIVFVCQLLDATPMNNPLVPDIIGTTYPAVFDIDFFAAGKIYHLTSEIIEAQDTTGTIRIKILSEKLWIKSANSKITKANLFSWRGLDPERVRDNSDEYLPDDVSIIIALKKQIQPWISYSNHVNLTDFNVLVPIIRVIPEEIISILDPSIESISIEAVNGKDIAKLKFYGEEEITLNKISDFNAYLSSGTIKGIRVFADAKNALTAGGYLIIDEIEDHFNHELVASLLRLFLDKQTNPKGAVIVFSTHYPELLDELERNDAVFITKHEPDGLKIENLSTLLKRNDMKKSEVYQSNYLGGTAPAYEALLALKKSITAGMVM